jgi:excisionase family DNA binding protein
MVSDETVRRRCDDGSLRAVRLGSVRRVFASELDRLFAEPRP